MTGSNIYTIKITGEAIEDLVHAFNNPHEHHTKHWKNHRFEIIRDSDGNITKLEMWADSLHEDCIPCLPIISINMLTVE